jgi:hypothetical protein
MGQVCRVQSQRIDHSIDTLMLTVYNVYACSRHLLKMLEAFSRCRSVLAIAPRTIVFASVLPRAPSLGRLWVHPIIGDVTTTLDEHLLDT